MHCVRVRAVSARRRRGGHWRTRYWRQGYAQISACGTSIGAINGAAIAADPTPDGAQQLLTIWDALAERGILGGSILGESPVSMRRRTSLHSNGAFRQMLRDRLPARTFEELAVPFECVAASIENAREHWFDTGDLVEPVLASCALPEVFPPVQIGRSTCSRRSGGTASHLIGRGP